MRTNLNLRRIAVFLIFTLYPILPLYFRLGKSLMFYYVMLFPAFICMFFVDKRLQVKRMLYKYTMYILLMLFLFVSHVEIIEIVKFVMAPILLAIFVCNVISSKKVFWKCLDLLIFTGGIMGFLGVIEGVTGYNVFTLLNNTSAAIKPDGFRMGIHRVKLGFNMSTNYCNYLIVIVALVLYRLYACKLTSRKRIAFQIVHFLLIINAFFTGSRAPLIVILLIEIIVLHKRGKTYLINAIKNAIILVFIGVIVGSVIGMPILAYVKSYFYVLLSLFDKSYQSKIELDFGSNLTVSDHRVRLYAWVYNGVKNHLLTGLGEDNHFVIQVNQWNTKTSIENEYLNSLLKYGVLGVIAQVNRLCLPLIQSWKSRKRNLDGENFSFNFVFFWALEGYCMNLFTVSIQTDNRILSLFIMLALVYNFNCLNNRSME